MRKIDDYTRFVFFDDEERFLRYSYYDVEVKGVEYLELDLSKIELKHQLYFETEENNIYDPNAIKIMYDDIFIGYIPKNNLQDMMYKYSDGIEKQVCGMTTYVDEKNKGIKIGLGFYEKYNKSNIDVIDTKIIVSNNTEIVEKGKEVQLKYDEEKEKYIVITIAKGILPEYELGEINESDSIKIKELEESGQDIKVGIFEIINNSSSEMECLIKIIAR